MVLRCGYLVLPSFTSFVLDGYLLTFPIRVGIDFTEFWGFFLRFLATFSLMRSSFFFVPCSPRFHRVFLKLRVPKPFERKVTGFFLPCFFFLFLVVGGSITHVASDRSDAPAAASASASTSTLTGFGFHFGFLVFFFNILHGPPYFFETTELRVVGGGVSETR